MVGWDFAIGSLSEPTDVVLTNFTRITANTFVIAGVSGIRGVASYKICDGTEDGAALTGMDGTTSDAKMIYLLRATRAIVGVAVGSLAADPNTGNPAGQTVASAAGVAPLAVFGCYGSTGAVDPRTFTVGGSAAKDGEITPATRAYLAYKIYDAAPADVVVDMDDEGSNLLASFYLQFTLAPVGVPPNLIRRRGLILPRRYAA